MVKRILVFAAHPDDDIIGCGGSIAKHVRKGNQVSVCYMTSGNAGSLDHTKKELARIRENEAKRAAEVVGSRNLIFLRNPDGYVTYDEDNLRKLVELIRKIRPHIVYVHHKSDGHRDHTLTYQLVNESIRRAGGPWFQECNGAPWPVETILAYEVTTPLSEFNYVEDISEFIDKKIAALKKHQSQVKDIRYDEAAEGLAKYRGATTGKGKYCEVFQVVKVTDLF
jgi:LmbE family N-acetylglucosaminyl deacetylase